MRERRPGWAPSSALNDEAEGSWGSPVTFPNEARLNSWPCSRCWPAPRCLLIRAAEAVSRRCRTTPTSTLFAAGGGLHGYDSGHRGYTHPRLSSARKVSVGSDPSSCSSGCRCSAGIVIFNAGSSSLKIWGSMPCVNDEASEIQSSPRSRANALHSPTESDTPDSGSSNSSHSARNLANSMRCHCSYAHSATKCSTACFPPLSRRSPSCLPRARKRRRSPC